MTLSRDQILAAAPTLTAEEVQVPEWGGTVRVQELTAAAADAFLASTVKRSRSGGAGEFDRSNFQAKLVVLTLVDEQGKRLFEDKDAAALGQKSAAVVSRLALVAMRLSGMTPQDLEEAKGN